MICPYQIGIIVLAADSITIHALAVEQDSMPHNCFQQDLFGCFILWMIGSLMKMIPNGTKCSTS